MAAELNEDLKKALNAVIAHPLLEHARELEAALTPLFAKRVFGRINQKSSIEAASESDRGVTERLANAFDTSLTAARLAAGIERSDRTFTPRNAAQRFFCLNADQCEWSPQDQRIQVITKPIIEFCRKLLRRSIVFASTTLVMDLFLFSFATLALGCRAQPCRKRFLH